MSIYFSTQQEIDIIESDSYMDIENKISKHISNIHN